MIEVACAKELLADELKMDDFEGQTVDTQIRILDNVQRRLPDDSFLQPAVATLKRAVKPPKQRFVHRPHGFVR